MKKILISLPEDVVREVDRAAGRERTSRSALVARLLRSALGLEKRAGLARRRRAFRDMDRLAKLVPAGDSTKEIREMRDAR